MKSPSPTSSTVPSVDAQCDDLEHRAGSFLDQDTLLDDRARQARLDALDPVLHLDRSGRGIRARNEIGGDLDLAERVARSNSKLRMPLAPLSSCSISRVTLL